MEAPPRPAPGADAGAAERVDAVVGIAARVVAYRERRGLSQAGLARLTGVSQSAISLLEAGSNPRADTLWAIARALGVTVGALFGESPRGLSPEEEQLIDAMRHMHPAAREILLVQSIPGRSMPRELPGAINVDLSSPRWREQMDEDLRRRYEDALIQLRAKK